MTHKNTGNWLKEKTVAKQFQYVQIGCLNIFDIPRRHSFLWGAPKPSPIIGSPAEAAETWWSLHVIACHCMSWIYMKWWHIVTFCSRVGMKKYLNKIVKYLVIISYASNVTKPQFLLSLSDGPCPVHRIGSQLRLFAIGVASSTMFRLPWQMKDKLSELSWRPGA